jgi:hypothetical protein
MAFCACCDIAADAKKQTAASRNIFFIDMIYLTALKLLLNQEKLYVNS